jgi:hypothetical protein
MSGRDAGSARNGGRAASNSEGSASGGQGGSTAETGGSAGTAGAGNTAAPDASAPSTDGCPSHSICFKHGQAQGLMSGWAWLDMGEPLTLDSPTCGNNHKPITANNPCFSTAIAWGTSDSLCMSGRIPALPASPICDPGPCGFPGFTMGVNAKDPNAPVGSVFAAYKTVTFIFTGEPKRGLRAFLHRNGDPDSFTYCLDAIASKKALSLATFNTKCWGDATTVYLEPKDLTSIDQIGIAIQSSSQVIDVRDFCLTGISFE